MRLIEILSLLLFILVAGADAKRKKPKWPYRWTGTYYNGTIDLATSIDRWPHCAEACRDSFTASFSGLFLVGPGSETNSPQFVLMAWDTGTVPAASSPEIDMGSDTDGWNMHSPDIRLILGQRSKLWMDNESEGDEMWSVETSTPRNGSGFAMDGLFTGDNHISSNPRATNSENWMNITIPGCQRRFSEWFKMIVSTRTAGRQRHSTQNITFQGTFDEQKATFRWNGTYWGSVQSEVWYGPAGTADDFAEGTFSVSFSGNVDSGRSDELRTRSGVGGPEWVKKYDREENVPREVEESGASFIQADRWLYMLEVALGLLSLV
ncbi:hypothetical protein ASPCAL03299 [Aspergillus calidoustus]|uniref:Uncharacterized protein n=1 Tax=Aspergillus calidoustus TaxID=454130 RepID=A0A0U5FYC7_ASPCI|nr:hypothetical protein ASPCAL03299 [Aspergillus calidoustus]